MDWVDRPKNYKGLYGILQLLQGSHLDNFSLKTLKLGWVAFHPRTFQLKCLDFQSNQYKKLAPVLSRFCNGLFHQCFSGTSGLVVISGKTHLDRKTVLHKNSQTKGNDFRPAVVAVKEARKGFLLM